MFSALVSDHGYIFVCSALVSGHGFKNEIYSCLARLFRVMD